MKTLLIFPPCSPFWEDSLTMPLGVCSLKAWLTKHGFESEILDLNVKLYLESEKKYLWDANYQNLWIGEDSFNNNILKNINLSKWIDKIVNSDADILGFSVSYQSVQISLYLVKQIKLRTGKKIIFGGPECHKYNVESFISKGVDVVVEGEGEQSLLELMQNFRLCPGVYMPQNDKIVYGGNRDLIDINTLAFPDFDDIIDDYKKLSHPLWLTVSFIRGCPNRCAFCEESVMWKKSRQRSPEIIVEELLYLKERYHPEGFHKGDSVLADSAITTNRICDLLIEKQVGLLWYSQARPEKWMSLDLLKKLKKAGCMSLSYGVETGSQKMLDKMRKNLQIENIKIVIKNSLKAEMMTHVNIMVDSPQETWIDFLKTVFFVLKYLRKPINYTVTEAGIPFRSDWFNNPLKY